MRPVDINFNFTDRQLDLLEATNNYREILFGGARAGGKSRGLRETQLYRRFKYPRSCGAIFRKTYPEIYKNHIMKMFNKEHPELKKYFHESKKILTLPNKSTLEFCYAENKRDLESKIQGQEWDDVSIDEAGDWTEEEYSLLTHCNRPTGAGIKPCMFVSANPGGRGHAHLKRKFITKDFREHEDPSRYHFIKSLVTDNPFLLLDDPDYLKTLEAETNPVLRAAFRYGDWDTTAGTFFDQLNREVHVIRPFKIPAHWERFGSFDWGYNHPFCWLWYAVDEDGNIYVTREYYDAKVSIDKQAIEVLRSPESKDIIFYAGHDCWAHKKDDNTPTIAEDFEEYGIELRHANLDRKLRAKQCRLYFDHEYIEKDGKKERIGPRVFIFDTCQKLFSCLGRAVHDPKNIEDVLKENSNDGDCFKGDDGYDSFGYGITSRPIASEPVQEKTRDWYREQSLSDDQVTGWNS